MENIKTPYKSVLTIAGSDSGGCAGIQADIKSISACGAYAASVITATTAQNTTGVFDIHPIPVVHIQKQLDAVLSDLTIDTVKIGMLHSLEVIHAIQAKLEEYKIKNIVIDPVMVATSGDPLIADDALAGLKKFLSKAVLITPNFREAELLIDHNIKSEDVASAVVKIGKMYKTSVLLKRGYMDQTVHSLTDILYLYDEDKTISVINTWVNTNNTHGTGCSLSSSIAAFLSLGDSLETAVRKGCSYVNQAILQGKNKVLGKGNGPINHFGLK